MARVETVTLTCDLDEERTEAVETVTFGYDGAVWDIDMCQGHLDAYHEVMSAYLDHARPGQPSYGPRRRSSTTSGSKAKSNTGRSKEEDQAIRQWGRDNGFTVGDRGRLSVAVLSAYEAVHRA